MRYARSAPLWLTALLLAAFGLDAWQLLERAPVGVRVAQIRLTPGDRPLILGHAELGQRPGALSAAADHLQLSHDQDGWWIANLSAQRRVDAPTATQPTRYLRRWPLTKGGRIRFGDTTLEVAESSPDRLVLSGPAGIVARWEDGRLTQPQLPFDACPTEGDPWWRRHWGKSAELRLFSLGGQVPCPRRWELQGVRALGAWVHWRNSQQGRHALDPDGCGHWAPGSTGATAPTGWHRAARRSGSPPPAATPGSGSPSANGAWTTRHTQRSG